MFKLLLVFKHKCHVYNAYIKVFRHSTNVKYLLSDFLNRKKMYVDYLRSMETKVIRISNKHFFKGNILRCPYWSLALDSIMTNKISLEF